MNINIIYTQNSPSWEEEEEKEEDELNWKENKIVIVAL